MLFQVYDVSHTLCQRMQAKKCKVRKVRGSQNGDFIDIKNDLVCKSRDRLEQKSAICFLPVSLDPGERYSCCANISNLRQHLWHMLAASLRRSQSRRLRNGQNFLECKDFLQLQTGENRRQEYSIIIENSRNRIMFLWPFVLFNSEAFFSKQESMTMDSTLLFLATTFSGLSFVFCYVYAPKRTATQLIFFFEKFPLKLWQFWIPFCLSFQTCWDFKARCHFVPFDKKGKALGTRLPFWSNFGAKLWS